MGTELAQNLLGPLTADPRQPGKIYASTNLGIARSEDGGASWEVSDIGCLRADEIVIDPTRPETLYITGIRSAGGSCSRTASICEVQKSTDGGRTWSHFRQGLASRDAVVLDLEIDPVDTRTLYAMTSGSGVFKSTDAGEIWAPLGTGLEGLRPEALLLDPRDALRPDAQRRPAEAHPERSMRASPAKRPGFGSPILCAERRPSRCIRSTA